MERERVALKLESFLGNGRTVTTNKFFISLGLAKTLLEKNTSLVGTVNKIRGDLPPPSA